MILLLFCQLPEGFQALGEKLIHVVGIGVTDKRTALSQNTIQGGITHKEASLGFFFFKLENTMEVRPDGAQKLQVIGQISGGVKGIFSQQDRKLSLDSKTWPQRFLQYVIFSQGSAGVEIQKQHIQGKLIVSGQSGVRERPEEVLIFVTEPGCFRRICVQGAQGHFCGADTCPCRVCQCIVEGQGIGGDFSLEKLFCEGLETGIFCDRMFGHIPCTHSQGKDQCEGKYFFQNFHRNLEGGLFTILLETEGQYAIITIAIP